MIRAIARAVLAALTLSAGCRDLEVMTASYGTLAEARQAGAMTAGRIPQGLPPGTFEMREAFDPDTNRRWGLFNFPPAEAAALKTLLEQSEHSLAGHRCEAPRRIEWWPPQLRGALDDARITATGLRAYHSTDGALVFAVNWNQGRAYYWSTQQ